MNEKCEGPLGQEPMLRCLDDIKNCRWQGQVGQKVQLDRRTCSLCSGRAAVGQEPLSSPLNRFKDYRQKTRTTWPNTSPKS